MTRTSALLRIVVVIIVNTALRCPERRLLVPCQREVTALRFREHRFGLLVVKALEACIVWRMNFASTFQSASIARLPFVMCDPDFYVFAPPLRWVMSTECNGLEVCCDEGHELYDHCIPAVKNALWVLFGRTLQVVLVPKRCGDGSSLGSASAIGSCKSSGLSSGRCGCSTR